MIKETKKIEFKKIAPSDKTLYEGYLEKEERRGCEFSFANLYLWGRQNFALLDGRILLFSQFDRRSVYPNLLGEGDKRTAYDAIIADSQERGIPCRITGLTEGEKEKLDELYPNRFRFHTDEGSYDYVYSIDDLADLKGKKYHAKRNHLNRFYEAYPDCRVEEISESNVERVRDMAREWYEARLRENPDSDFQMEKAALEKALRDYAELGLFGIALTNGGEVLAFTVGSRFYRDTIDVHFEKARADAVGAYPAINCEFAKYIRNKLPEIEYLDREEDMGIEGLRKAKKSYHPVFKVKKYWACLLEDGYEY